MDRKRAAEMLRLDPRVDALAKDVAAALGHLDYQPGHQRAVDDIAAAIRRAAVAYADDPEDLERSNEFFGIDWARGPDWTSETPAKRALRRDP